MNCIFRRFLFIAAAMAVLSGVARGQGICPSVDAFLNKCPTNDPASSKILSDFSIRREGVPISIAPSSCSEPVSAMNINQYTDELSLLQALRTTYYLHPRPDGELPWTSLSLYDWLKSKVSGFNFNSAATMDSCCVMIEGKNYVTLRVNNDSNREYHRTWEGIAEWIGLLMHEARHMDNFPHSSCCAAGVGACDMQYDESNLSPYGIQYWLEKSFIDGTLCTCYTCVSAERVNAIKSWFRTAANQRVANFCSNAPSYLTEQNNPQPPCDQSCAAGNFPHKILILYLAPWWMALGWLAAYIEYFVSKDPEKLPMAMPVIAIIAGIFGGALALEASPANQHFFAELLTTSAGALVGGLFVFLIYKQMGKARASSG